MPDPFDFISTRSEINDLPDLLSTDLPKIDNVSLIPLVSADNKTNPETSVLDNIVNAVNLLPDNSPAYEYKAKEERRYSNPYLQFTPDTRGRGDIENVYGQNQGSIEQLINSILVKLPVLTGATFISNYASIPANLDLIRSGKAIDAFKDDATFSAVQNWTEGIEDQFPNYYTQWERDHPYLSIISPTGFANVWGDKVIKNIGFTVGGLAAGITQGAALEVLTGGLGTPLAFMKAAKVLEGSFGSLIRGFRNLSKVGVVGKTDDVLNGLKYTKDTLEAIKATSRLNQIRTGATLTATTYLSAQGEAFIEGYHTYIDTKKQLIENALNEGNLTPDKLNQIEKDAQDAGRYTTGLNIPLLMASNLVQFPIILGGKAFGSVNKGLISKSITEEGVKFTNDHTFRKGLKAWGKESLKGFVSEGLEEGNQYFIGNSLHDYYTDKIDPQSKKGLAEYMLNNIPKVLRDEQFQQEAFFGGLSGVAMGAPFARGRYFKTSGTQSTVDHLNNVYDNFNKGVKNFTHTIQLQDATDNPDGKHNADIAHKALFSAVHDSLRIGTYDMHQDILEDMKHLTLEEFNKTFGTEFENDNEKLAHVQGLVYESEQIKKDVINTNKYFMTNPFTQNKLLQKVKQALSSKDEYAIANAQERLFEDFKELAAFNQSRLRTVGYKLSDKITSLKTLGAKDESIQYLITIAGSPKGLTNYLQWKGVQLEALDKSIAYFEKMKGLGSDLDPNLKVDMEKEYKEAIKRKQFLEAYMSTVQSEKDQDKVLDLILREETTGEQQLRFMENLKKTTKEAADLQAQQTNLEVEQEDLTSPESKTAEELINLNQQVGEQNTPVDNEAEIVPPVEDTSKWTTKFKQGDKLPFGDKPYTITQVLEDALIVTDDKGIQHKVTQIDVNGQLSYAIDALTNSPTEQMQSQAPTDTQSQETIQEPQVDPVKTLQEKKDEIEKNRQKELKQYLASGFPIVKYNPNGDNEILTGEDADFANERIERLIQNGIRNGKTAEEIIQSVLNGYAFSFGAVTLSINNFIRNRVAGVTNQSFGEFRKNTHKEINDKYDKELLKVLQEELASGKLIKDFTVTEQKLLNSQPQVDPIQSPVVETVNSLTQEEKEEFISSNEGKIVTINGKSGKLTRVNESLIEIENENSIYEIAVEDINTMEILPKVIENKNNLSSKYKISEISENTVTVNGQSYTIETDSNGNIFSLIPIDNPAQKIKNEKLLIAVEIERNRLDINSSNIEEELEKVAPEGINAALDNNNFSSLGKLLDTIFSVNFTESIETALEKLYNKEKLTEQEQLQTGIWLSDAFDRLSKLFTNNLTDVERQTLLNAYDNLEIILCLLYNKELKETTKTVKNDKEKSKTIRKIKVDESSEKSKRELKRLQEPKQELVAPQPLQEPITPTETLVEEKELLNSFDQSPTLTKERIKEIRGKKTEVQVYHPVTFSEQGFTYQDIIDNPGMYFSLDKVAFPSGKLYTAKVVKGKVTGEIVEVKFDSTMEKNKGLDRAKKPYFSQDHYKTLEFRQVLWEDSKALETNQVVPNQENDSNNANYIEMFFKDNNSTLKDSVLLLINKGMIKIEC